MLEESLPFRINGLLAIGTHFFTRVVMVPFMYYSYASQYHHGNWLAAVQAMKPICHVLSGIGFVLQVYWFVKMIKLFVVGARNVLLKKKTT